MGDKHVFSTSRRVDRCKSCPQSHDGGSRNDCCGHLMDDNEPWNEATKCNKYNPRPVVKGKPMLSKSYEDEEGHADDDDDGSENVNRSSKLVYIKQGPKDSIDGDRSSKMKGK